MSAVKHQWSKLAGLWCSVMHERTSWPIHGHYWCQQCHREYSVPWK